MALYIKKTNKEIINQIVQKLVNETPVSSTGPGSIARALAESISTELSDFYSIMDWNIAQSVVSTANGSALDRLGSLYGITRRTVSATAEVDRRQGAFYFYIDTPIEVDITIPTGIKVYTSTDDFIGVQYSFKTTEPAIIKAGNTRVYASLTSDFAGNAFTAGLGTLIVHNFTSPAGTTVRCTNPKVILSQSGYETDDNYRMRIIKQVRVSSGGTSEALRLRGLVVPGVRDIRIREAAYGLGSFEVVVTPEVSGGGPALLNAVSSAIGESRAVGTRMFLTLPTLLPTDIYVTMVITKRTQAQNEKLMREVREEIRRYLNSFLAGETLTYNSLIQRIMNASELVHDVQVTRFAPNGKEALRKNYKPLPNEQISPGRIEVSIA